MYAEAGLGRAQKATVKLRMRFMCCETSLDANCRATSFEARKAPYSPVAERSAKLPGPPQTTWTPESQNGGPGQLQPLIRLVFLGSPAWPLGPFDASGGPRR